MAAQRADSYFWMNGKNNFFDTIQAMKIHVLVTDKLFDTGLASVLDTFGIANELALAEKIAMPAFEVKMIGVRRQVHTAHGLKVPVTLADTAGAADVLLVPGIGVHMPKSVDEALATAEMVDTVALLRERAESDQTVMAAACTGAFLLASTGLLDGQNATTTWWLGPMFRERFPEVKLDESRMLVSSGRYITAGAAMAHLDLALSLVRRSSPALAALTARYMLADARASQASYVVPQHLVHSDPMVERFERWARQRLAQDAQGFSLGDAAAATGTSERTLARRLRAVLGKTPLSYFQDLRVERAMHLLQSSNDSIDQIASRVGYADGTTLRALLRRKLGRGVRELRTRE